ncbi:hypothetical protein [Geothrix fuzhouensis]|uniref:hypothetical protein n=1 Tax=Geothrix fuzhouensis TaxID=2966451 RepID=UPI002148900E|nr:hypothetical protein [Geothrix fuzhouensis]
MSLSPPRNFFILLCSLSLEPPGGLGFETGGADRVMGALMPLSIAGYIYRI